MKLPKQLDWVAKLELLQSYRDRDGLDWDDPKLHLVDLQYADLRPDKGLYYNWSQRGPMQRLLDRRGDRMAVSHPPNDTRAYFRGRCMQQYPAGRGRLLGLGDLRPAGPGLAAADPDPGPAARHEAACRRTSRPLRHRE